MDRNSFRNGWLATLLFVPCLGFGIAAAQDLRGSVAGRVTDESGSALPGVTVEARGTAFAASRVAVTDRAGSYALRLPGEPASGVDDIHTHPAEPRSARLSVLYSF